MNKVDKFVMWDERKEFKDKFGEGCSSSSLTSSSSSSDSSDPSDSESSSATSEPAQVPPSKRQKTE